MARTLSRARGRLLLLARLHALGPPALASAILAQLTLLEGSPRLLCGALAAGALAWGLLRARGVAALGGPAVGAYLDARLEGGAVLSSAAEALAGSHSRFRAPLLLEAAERLREAGPRASVPWRLSPAWALALAATALSPLSLASAPPPPPPRLGGRSLLDPSLLAAGGGQGGDSDPGQPGPEPSGARYGVAEGGQGEPESQPLELPLDVIAALARAAGPRSSGGGEGSSADPGEQKGGSSDSILDQASQSVAGALRELEELKSAAESGDRAARVRLDRLREALAQASGGGGGPSAPTESAPPTSGGAGASAPSAAGAAQLPTPLAGALERYFGS